MGWNHEIRWSALVSCFRARALPVFFLVSALFPGLFPIRAETESEDAINVAALLQDEDLLDALILGDHTIEDAVELNHSSPSPSRVLATDDVVSSDQSTKDSASAPLPTVTGHEARWDIEVSGSLGLGYKENVLYSAYHQQNSAFSTAEFESMWLRLAPPDDWQFYAYLLAENAHYFDVDGLDDEWLAVVMLQGNRKVGAWEFGLGGQYTFLQQAFALSFEELDLGSSQVVLNQFNLTPSLEYHYLKHAYFRVAVPIEANRFDDADQDYGRFEIQLAAGREFKRGGKVEALYGFELRDYRDRDTRDASGMTQEGNSLEWQDHRVDLVLDYYFDEDRAWRTSSLLRLRRVVDNGSGYDDFWMYRAHQKLFYSRPTWELSVQASYTHYDYDVQTVTPDSLERRYRSRLSLGGEWEKEFRDDWALTVAYAWEDYHSNIPDDTYRVSVLSLDLSHTF